MKAAIRSLIFAVVVVVALSGSATAAQTLRDILPPELKKGLTPAEKILLEHVQKGWAAGFTANNDEIDNPENAARWGSNRTIRAELVRWLCTNREVASIVDPNGIEIKGARIVGPLDLRNVDVRFTLKVLRCSLESVDLIDAHVQTLSFNESLFASLMADRLTSSSNLFMRRTKVNGEVRLPAASIGGDLDCDSAKFCRTFIADGICVAGSVKFNNGFIACGEVKLTNMDIGGNFECTDAKFINPNGYALSIDGVTVKRSVYLCNNFIAKGEVSIIGAEFGQDINCNNASFITPKGRALTIERSTIKGGLFLDEIKELRGIIDLRDTKSGSLVDDEKSWPDNGNLKIDGFEYDNLSGDKTPIEASKRIEWLRLQPTQLFHPRPYQHLAKIYADMGRDSDAREVMIAMNNDLWWYGQLGFWGRLWHGFLGITIAYGYKSWWAVYWLIGFWFIGWRVFRKANNIGIMQCASKECWGQAFSPAMYSLDTLLPIINFHQKDYYLPDSTKSPEEKWFNGRNIRRYFWVHIALGWIFTTLLVVSLTGLVH